jgi:signal transduction histidine kinase
MTSSRRFQLGLRREVSVLLPATLFLLVLLSGFAVLSYRSGVQLLIEERQIEVSALARQLATTLAVGPLPSEAALHRRAPRAKSIVVLDDQGHPLVSYGDFGTGPLLASLQGPQLSQTSAIGPDSDVGPVVVGFAPLNRSEGTQIVRVDLPATQLDRQRRTAQRLLWVVLPVDVALMGLVLLFLPSLTRPFDALLQQARTLGGEPGDEDEVTFLISTVEKAMAALREPEDRAPEDDIAVLQRTLAPSLESGFLLLDMDGKVLAVNPVGAELLEVDPPPEPTPVGVLLPHHVAFHEALAKAADQATGLPRQEVVIETSLGSRLLGLTVHALRRDDGAVRGHLVLFVDLTETQRLAEQEQLETSLAQLGELAAGVAHELRNSLATLRGYLTLIERRPQEESINDFLSEIRRESDHLQRVLEDFLTFARPETTRIEAVSLAQVVRRAAADPALEGTVVQIEIEDKAPHTLQGDSQLLERAIRNLLHNAVEAQSGSGTEEPIQTRLSKDQRQVELVIEDRGPGLPDQVRERLFQPFVTGRPDGVGLGLSLTHRIVTLHGGTVDLEDRPDGGTRVTLSFPLDVFE